MEFEGKEYSDEFTEKLKETYLTVHDFTKHPIAEEFGLTRAEAKRMVAILVPKPELNTVEDACNIYDKYPSLIAFNRALRIGHPITFLLETFITEDKIREMYHDRNLTFAEMLDEMQLPPLVTEDGVKSYVTSHGITRKPENKEVNKIKARREWAKNPEKVKASQEKARKTSLKNWGYPHPQMSPVVREKAENTTYKRHGVRYSTQTSQMKEKSRQTNLLRRGVENPFQSEDVKEKSRSTNMQNLGVDNPQKNPQIQEKTRNTNMARRGFPYPMQSPEVQKKAQKTNLIRYNETTPLKSKDIKEKIRNTHMKRRGVPNPKQWRDDFQPTKYVSSLLEAVKVTENEEVLRDFLRRNFPDKDKFTLHEIALITGREYHTISSKFGTKPDFITPSVQGHLPEQIQGFLEELGYVSGVDFLQNDRTAIKPLEIDFYFPKQKVGIEVNDLWSHNNTYLPFGLTPKPKNYHMEKSLKAKEQGIRLIHAWEHYFNNPQQYEVLKNAIKHALGISKYRVYARNTYVKEVPNKDLKEFFNTNNIQGFRGAKTAYALFDKKTDEVLMAYSVGASHFAHNKYDMELIRGASKLDTTIVGGASKLWKFIIDSNPEVNSIVYYIDRNIYNGSSIGTLEGNLELVSTQVGFWNYFVDTEEIKNRQPAKHKEIKELVAQGKVWEVYNAGTETYVWTRS